MSRDTRDFVATLLRAGLATPLIVQRVRDQLVDPYMVKHRIHDRREAEAKYAADRPHRDYYITPDDVNAIKAKLDAKLWMRHPNVQESLRQMWEYSTDIVRLLMELQTPIPGTREHEEYLRQQQESASDLDTDDEADESEVPPCEQDTSAAPDVLPVPPPEQVNQTTFKPNPRNFTPFHLGFSFPSCIKAALKYGRVIMMDSTHATNNQGYPMTTLLVVDDHGHGHPVAWFFSSNELAESLIRFLEEFNMEVGALEFLTPSGGFRLEVMAVCMFINGQCTNNNPTDIMSVKLSLLIKLRIYGLSGSVSTACTSSKGLHLKIAMMLL